MSQSINLIIIKVDGTMPKFRDTMQSVTNTSISSTNTRIDIIKLEIQDNLSQSMEPFLCHVDSL